MSIHRIGDLVRVNYPLSDFHGQCCIVLTGLRESSEWGRSYIGHMVSIGSGIPGLHDTGEPFCTFPADELIPISRLTVDELADAKEVA